MNKEYANLLIKKEEECRVKDIEFEKKWCPYIRSQCKGTACVCFIKARVSEDWWIPRSQTIGENFTSKIGLIPPKCGYKQ